MRPRDRTYSIALFAITLLLCSWFLDQAQNDNTVSRGATVASIVEQGTVTIDSFAHLTGDKALVDGHYISEKAPLPAWLVVPFHGVLNSLGMIRSSTADHINVDLLQLGGFLCGSVPFALIVLICWKRVQSERLQAPTTVMVLITFFGSFLFIYSGSFYGHLLAALFLLTALVALERGQTGIAGALVGCAVLCDYPAALFAGCWMVDLLMKALSSKGQRRWQPLFRFALGGLPFAILLVVVDTLLFGDPFSVGYDHVAGYRPEDGSIFDRLRPEAIWGLTLSSYRGLLFHMPVLAVALVLWIISRPPSSTFADLRMTIPVVLTFLFVCSIGMWWGGWAFGPRHLTSIGVLLAYKALPTIARMPWARAAGYVAGGFGLIHAFAAKCTVWYSQPTEMHHPISEVILPAMHNGAWTAYQWPILAGCTAGQGCALFVLIFALSLALIHVYERGRTADHAPVLLP